MKQVGKSMRDPAWQALVLRPQYRAELLASDTLTYETLVAREYGVEDRASDAAWARSMRDAQTAFVSTPAIAVAGYPVEVYVGYRVGPRPRLEPDGLVLSYKAFIEVRDFQQALSPERYAGFVARLDAHGLWGDSKISLRPGQVRFQYNNVIVHAPTLGMALCAEAVGVAYFGAAVKHVGRGIDAKIGPEAMDWHHFLLTGRYGELPSRVQDFIEYRTPVATLASCPSG